MAVAGTNSVAEMTFDSVIEMVRKVLEMVAVASA